MVRTHKDLDVWVKSVNFVTEVYKITSKFPRNEIFGLTSQMRRAAVSIGSNIAEGAARKSKNEFKQFLFIALSSTAELDTQIIIANNLGYLSIESKENLTNDLNTISRMLQGLIKSITP